MTLLKHSVLIASLALAGCVSSWDLKGHDPKEYYAKHPVKNTVETRSISQTVHFERTKASLSDEEKDKLRGALYDIAPAAIRSVQIGMNDTDMKNEARKKEISRLLRSLGYRSDRFLFTPSATVAKDEVEVGVLYSIAISPRCPDWRRSPVTTYSNTRQGNFGCAHVTNLGLMVADPNDLVKGASEGQIDTERASKVIQDYRAGKDFGPSGESSGGDTSGSGASAVAEGVSGLTGGQ